jgi:hypothetical protein
MAATTKLSLYNGALQLLGERRLLTDTDDVSTRYDLDALYDTDAVDYCLELVKPRYSTVLLQLTGVAPTGDSAFDFAAPIPADFIAMFQDIEGRPAIFQDGREESPITRMIREGQEILSDFEFPFIRYCIAHTDPQLPDIPPSFAKVVSAYMARELAWKYDPDAEEMIQTKLEQRVEVSKAVETGNEPQQRGFAPDVLTDKLRGIYNDCLQILQMPPIVSNTDDSVAKNRISIALDNGLVGSVLEDTSWNFGLQSDQLFYDPSIDPPWGYQYVMSLPSDWHRINGVYVDELMRTPLRDYVQQVDQGTGNTLIYSSQQIIYVEYVSKLFLTDYENWPDFFKRLVAARMAIDANIPGGNKEHAVAQYTQRRREAMSTNAINGVPKRLSMGSWSRSRLYAGNINRDRP